MAMTNSIKRPTARYSEHGWMADGRKQEVGPDGKLVLFWKRMKPSKGQSDIVRLVPSTPERVETIQRIFRLHLAGYGGHHIAARLNEDGIASYTGVKWVSRQIRGIGKPCL